MSTKKTVEDLMEVYDNISVVKGEEQAAIASYLSGIAGALRVTTRSAMRYFTENGKAESVANCAALHNNSVQGIMAILSILEKHYPGISADCKTMHKELMP
jgi:hypothetical protein